MRERVASISASPNDAEQSDAPQNDAPKNVAPKNVARASAPASSDSEAPAEPVAALVLKERAPIALDEGKVVEILKRISRGLTVVSAVGTAAPAAVALAAAALFPPAALASIPAAILGFVLSRRAMRRQMCADLGISDEQLAEIERLLNEVSLDELKRDVRTMTVRDWIGANHERIAGEIVKRLGPAKTPI